MKNLLFIIFFIQIFLLTGCSNNQVASKNTPTFSDNSIKTLLDNCDKEQGRVNTPTIPRCYISAFKNEGWSKEEAIKYMKEKKVLLI